MTNMYMCDSLVEFLNESGNTPKFTIRASVSFVTAVPLSKQITLPVEREIHDKKFSARVAHASSLIAPNKGFGRMNGAPCKFQCGE